MMLMLQMQRQKAGQALDGGILAYQAVKWDDGSVQRRTVALEFECPEGCTANIKETPEGPSPILRVGRCRRDATKAGSRRLSQLVQVFESPHAGGAPRWFHEALVEIPENSALATLRQNSQPGALLSPPPVAPQPPSAVPTPPAFILASPRDGSVTTTPRELLSAAPEPALKRRRAECAAAAAGLDAMEAAARLGAALALGGGAGGPDALILMLHIHELFPDGHRELSQRLGQDGETFLSEAEARLRDTYPAAVAELLVGLMHFGIAQAELTRALRVTAAGGDYLVAARCALLLSLTTSELHGALNETFCVRVRSVLRGWERSIGDRAASAAAAEEMDSLFGQLRGELQASEQQPAK